MITNLVRSIKEEPVLLTDLIHLSIEQKLSDEEYNSLGSEFMKALVSQLYESGTAQFTVETEDVPPAFEKLLQCFATNEESCQLFEIISCEEVKKENEDDPVKMLYKIAMLKYDVILQQNSTFLNAFRMRIKYLEEHKMAAVEHVYAIMKDLEHTQELAKQAVGYYMDSQETDIGISEGDDEGPRESIPTEKILSESSPAEDEQSVAE